MQAALDITLPYVRERKQFDAAIGTFGLMQGKIADMYTALQSSRALPMRWRRTLTPATPFTRGRRQLPAARQ